MAELCAILEGLGAKHPQSYIQSGNVVVTGALSAPDIANAVATAKGFKPQVLIFSAENFAQIARDMPFTEPNGKLAHIWFATTPFTFDQATADTLRTNTERLHITRKAIYLHAPDGIGRSRLAAKIETLAGVPGTARNMNTVTKLIDLLDAHPRPS